MMQMGQGHHRQAMHRCFVHRTTCKIHSFRVRREMDMEERTVGSLYIALSNIVLKEGGKWDRSATYVHPATTFNEITPAMHGRHVLEVCTARDIEEEEDVDMEQER